MSEPLLRIQLRGIFFLVWVLKAAVEERGEELIRVRRWQKLCSGRCLRKTQRFFW